MQDLNEFLINRMPLGVLVFDHTMDMVFCNRQTKFFLNRFTLPEEIRILSKRIFDAIQAGKLADLFPGEVLLSKPFKSSPSTWIFQFFVRETPEPLVVVFITEDTFSHKLNLSEIREQFRLTRREIDILRRVLDGLKNSEIAEDLEIAEQTVKDHLSNIYMKLGVKNRFTLMRSLMKSADSS
jgi:DNA-binding CsgD family transcriptional regulator